MKIVHKVHKVNDIKEQNIIKNKNKSNYCFMFDFIFLSIFLCLLCAAVLFILSY